MTDKEHDRLKELFAFLENQHAVENIEDVVEHLQLGVSELMIRSRALAQQATILLFQSPDSILTFLDVSGQRSEDVRKRDISHARIKVLSLLALFLKRYGKHVALSKKHVIGILTRCKAIARLDWSNKVRAEALTVVINVLKHANSLITVEDMEPIVYVDKLFYDLKFSKATQTAKGTMLEVVGHMAHIFPSQVADTANPLIIWIEDTLDKQFASPSPELLLLKGLWIALTRLVELDPHRYDNDVAKREKLYTYLNRVFAITVEGQMTRYGVTKAAMLFLTQHASIFREQLGSNGYIWFTYVRFCVIATNKTIKEHAYAFADRVLQVVGEYLTHQYDDRYKKVIHRMLKEVLPVLSDAECNLYQTTFVLNCMGRWASAILMYMGIQGFLKIEDRLRKFGENLLVLNDKITVSRWTVFTYFVQCIGSFMEKNTSNGMDDAYVTLVADLICHILDAYPRCLRKTKVLVYKSILLILQAIEARGGSTQRTLDHIVSHGLLLTISNVTEAQEMVVLYHPETGNVETKLLYEYEEFWIALLRGKKYTTAYKNANMSHLNSMEMTASRYERLRGLLLDSLLKHILQVLEQLDLSYQYDLQSWGEKRSDGYKPSVARDHSILINLTEFFERVIPRIQPQALRSWLPTLMHYIFEKSYELPLVSSFYRMTRVLTVIADELLYFDMSTTQEQDRIRLEYILFIDHVVENLRFYKDELLLATTGCILVAPVQLLSVDDFIKAIIPTLLIGRSYYPAANMAITGLERWQQKCQCQLETVYDRVIPCLASYLDLVDQGVKDHLETSDRDSIIDDALSGSEYSILQRRVMTFLGKAGGEAAWLMSEGGFSSIVAGRRGFHSAKPFQVSLFLQDQSVDLVLDSIFVHIRQLACESRDRRVKAAACEMFHALVCFLCGKTATHAQHASGEPSVFSELWKSVAFPGLIQLATDVEKICRALFEPLLFQTVRWICSTSETFPYEYSNLLDALVEGLADATNTAVRDLCGNCLSTCLSTAIEITPLGKPMTKADAVFQRLFSLCRHPGSAQRIGAATAISYFLRTLNEENATVISTFALRCLKSFLVSLRLCDDDARNGLGGEGISQNIITKAIMKLQRAITRFPHMFSSRKVKQVAKIEGNSDEDDTMDSDLDSMTEWLFEQSARPESVYRQTCRQVFFAFSALVEPLGTKKWIEKYAMRHGGVASIALVLAPVDTLSKVTTLKAYDYLPIAEWMEHLTASIECYMWCSELLGDQSIEFLGVDAVGSNSRLKRKIAEENQISLDSKMDPERQLTISWAIQHFFKIETSANLSCSDGPSYRTYVQFRRASMQVTRALCAFVGTLYNSLPNSFVPCVVAVESDPRVQDELASTLLRCLKAACNAMGENRVNLVNVRTLCEKSMQHGGMFANKLRHEGDSVLLKLQHEIDSCDVKHDNQRIESLYSTMQLVNMLIEYGVIRPSPSSTQADVLLQFTTSCVMKTPVSPRDRALAFNAIKIAIAFGWNVSSLFDDDSLRSQLAAIYGDIILFIPTLTIWPHAIGVLLTVASTHRLGALVEALSHVASLRLYRPGSPEIDTFVEALLPHISTLVKGLTQCRMGDTSCLRGLLEALLNTVTILQHTSSTLKDRMREGPLPLIRRTALEIIKRHENLYAIKSDCLSILAVLGSNATEIEIQETIDALCVFVVEEFPISSNDVKYGTRDYDVFYMLLTKLLYVVEQSRSINWVRILYRAMKEGEKHLFASTIKSSLGRFAENIGTVQDTSIIVQHMMDLVDMLLDSSGDITVRTMLLKQVLIPMVELQNPDQLRAFFLTHGSHGSNMGRVATIISGSVDLVSSGAHFTAAVAYSLVELLYRLVDPELIRTELNTAFLGHGNGKGRELTMLVCKSASKFVTRMYEDVNDSTRFSCCQAYNCLLTAVSRTQKQEKFYDQILFQESLWLNVINVSYEYSLKAETSTFDRISLSSLSSSTLRYKQQRHSTHKKPSRSKDSSSVLQFLTGSSLSQTTKQEASVGGMEHFEMNQESRYEIELDPINDHECMIPLLRVLVQMEADFGSTWDPSTMPGWMNKIYNVIADPTTELNIRLFLVKVVLNIPQVFTQYASLWAEKMMDTLLEAISSQSEFHYVLRDFCHLLVDEWSEVVQLSMKSMKVTASRFVNELIRVSPYPGRELIQQENIVLVTKLILIWKGMGLQIDTSQLVQLLVSSHPDNIKREISDRYIALQVVSAMLSANLCQDLLSEKYEKQVEEGILNALTHKRASIQVIAAEVCGLILGIRGSTAPSSGFREQLLQMIVTHYTEEDFGRFLSLLRSVAFHEPHVIDSSMLHRLAFVLPKVVGIHTWALSAVECLLFATQNEHVVNELFTHCQPVLVRLVWHRNHQVQIIALQVVDALVNHLDTAKLQRLALSEKQGGLGLFDRTDGPSQEVDFRNLYYAIASKLFHKNVSKSLQEEMRRVLLRGFGDPDAGIRRELIEQWEAEGLLLPSPKDRLLALFGALYAPNVADLWVLYATNILLQITTKDSERYETKALFSDPLSTKNEFKETTIDSAWETKDQTMAPLFSVETDLFSASRMLSSSEVDETPAANNTISQSQLISSSLTQGSLSIGSRESDHSTNTRRQSIRRRFIKQKTVEGSKQALDQSTVSYFKERHALMKKNEEATLNRQRKARTQQVTMRRKYRAGEYPDIQIKLRDLVEPLMTLCEMHATTAALVLAEIVSALVTTPQFQQGEIEDSNTLETLGDSMQVALEQGKHSLVFVSAVHLVYFSCIMKDTSLLSTMRISSKVVGESSLASGSHHSGELILEEYLNYDEYQTSVDLEDVMAECSDQLYKILATVQKRNLLMALASRCCTTEEAKLALEAQLTGDLPTAISAYRKAENLLESGGVSAHLITRFEATRCYWERLNCLEKLNHWEKISREMGDSELEESLEYMWKQEPPYLEQGIGHCFHSYLGMTPLGVYTQDEGEDSELMTNLKTFLKTARDEPHRWSLTQNRFGIEVCLTSLVFGNVNEARVAVENVYPSILKQWNATSAIASQSRLELMQTLASAVEIDAMLTMVTTTTNIDAESSVFMKTWSHALPSQGEGSIPVWSQFYIVQRILSAFLLHQENLSDITRTTILQEQLTVMLKYASMAVSNDVLALASKYLKEYRELCNTHNLPKVSVLMVDVFVSHVLKLAERQAQKAGGNESTTEVLQTITRYYETSTRMFDNTDIVELMEKLPIAERIAMGTLEAKTFGKAAQFFIVTKPDLQVTKECLTRAMEVYKRSCSMISSVDTTMEIAIAEERSYRRCRLTFIEFLMDLLVEDGKSSIWNAFVSRETLVAALTDNVLKGMQRGDEESANYFPHLCELIPSYQTVVTDFEYTVLHNLPIWTCLRWSAQLLALATGAIGPTIIRILEKMASKYPVALFYDFKVMCGRTNEKVASVFGSLQVLLANPVMEKFVDALRLIHHPELRLKEGLREVFKLLENGKTNEAKDYMTHVWADCIQVVDHPRLGTRIGHYNRDWARRVKREMEKILGCNGQNVTIKTVTTAREWIMNHFQVIPGTVGITKDMKARLIDFAEWLEEFDSTKCRLELPGQYTTNWGKPEPSHHIYILSFASHMKVLASKQLPKQVTLHCSNQQEYTFLVKGGEDLRLDQRIEQLFQVMNQILYAQPRCRERQLHLSTYKVHPMTTEIGLIEWLDQTSTLKSVIEKQLKQDGRCMDLQSNKRSPLQLFNTTAATMYEQFLMKQRGTSLSAKVVTPSQNEVLTTFEKVQQQIPKDLLRRQLFILGSDYQDFIMIRDHFASSVAVFNVCSYLLGIGDRHLDNFLLDHTTGRVIGIDFGISFGAGASVLPVPELIPFRWTRQMQVVLHPYDSSHVLAQDMQIVLEALRDKKQVIESVMKVFLHEPLLDWQQSTTTHQQEIFASAETDDNTSGKRRAKAIAWLPEVKIAIARRKLEGFSPRMLLKEELSQNPHLGKQMKQFHDLVDRVMETQSITCQSISALTQAQELLALATAPDLLGRTYHGWMPWL